MTAAARKKNVVALPAQPTSELVEITPDLAREWLGVNLNNRKLRDSQVKKYGRDMAAGKFPITGSTIAFDRTGRLIDGQHRLHAIVAAGVTIKSFVVFGLDPVAQDFTDIGAARPAADILGFHGYANRVPLASLTKLAYLFDEDRLHKDSKDKNVSAPQILEYIAQWPATEESAAMCSTLRKNVDMAPSVLGAAIFLCSRVDGDAADVFFHRLADGASLEPGSPILALRTRLREMRLNKQRPSPEAALSLTIRAWNAWRAGRSLRSLPVYKNGTTIRCPKPQ